MINQNDKILGLLWGAAIGDALGLPYEGLTKKQINTIFKDLSKFNLIFGKGVVSDDTDHMLLTLLALAASKKDPFKFTKLLAKHLKNWLICLPPGIGFGTLTSLLKLWIGVSPEKSGSKSAGNGSCMRSLVIGAFCDSETEIEALVIRSTLITHRDHRSIIAALAIARIAYLTLHSSNSDRPMPESIFKELNASNIYGDSTWGEIVEKMRTCYREKLSVSAFQKTMNLDGFVSGFAYHSVPVALYSYLINFGNLQKTLEDSTSCGGDTDTIGFMAGGLSGGMLGFEKMPHQLRDKIIPWNCDIGIISKMQHMADVTNTSIAYPWHSLVFRNLLTWLVVILHTLVRFFFRATVFINSFDKESSS